MAYDTRLLSGIGVFAAVVETGSFGRAGDALGLTGSGVSRSIARLESRIGVRLLDRSPRAIGLTEEGRRFHARISPLLDEAEMAAVEAKRGLSVLTGRLRISADAPAARWVLAPMLPTLIAAHPGLSVEIVVRETPGDLVAHGFDAGVHFGEVEEAGRNGEILGETRVLTVASPSWLDAHGVPDHPSALSERPAILMRDPVSRAAYLWSFRKGEETLALRPRGAVIASDGTTMLAACVAGAGVAQLLEIEVEEALASGALRRLFDDWSPDAYLCRLHTPGGRFQPPRIKAFVEALRVHCGKRLTGLSQSLT